MAGLIAGLLIGLVCAFIFAMLLFPRLMQDLPLIREQWREIYEQKGDAIARWNRVGCLGQFLYFALLVLLLVNGQIIVFISLFFLIVPLGFILEGARILNLGYAEIRPVFRSLYFITGRRAVRRGRIRLSIGLLLLVVWLSLVVYILGRWFRLF